MDLRQIARVETLYSIIGRFKVANGAVVKEFKFLYSRPPKWASFEAS
jgi:hypothetical protein